jgi:hypothetical protein
VDGWRPVIGAKVLLSKYISFTDYFIRPATIHSIQYTGQAMYQDILVQMAVQSF